MERRAALERSKEAGGWTARRRCRCGGAKEFREELLERIAEKQGRRHYGEELRESDEQKAERLVKEMLKQARWTEGDLKRRRKGDPKKARMAARLRAKTTMTWAWISRRLQMGHWQTAANAVRAE